MRPNIKSITAGQTAVITSAAKKQKQNPKHNAVRPVIHFPMISRKWVHWSVIRRNKYYPRSLLNQQNRVIDPAPHIANRILRRLARGIDVIIMISVRQKGGQL